MNLYGYDWPQGGTKQVIYVDEQRHLRELVVGLNSPWQAADVTALTNAPLPGDFNLAGYAWSAGGTKQIAYVDGRGHVIELYVATGMPWRWADVTTLTDAPAPGGSVLVGYDWLNVGTKQIAYVDERGHVIELYVATGASWQWADLTELTGAPLPGDLTLTGYTWPAGGTKQIAYVDKRGHIIELYVAAGTPWQWADVTALTDAPLSRKGTLAGSAWSAGGTKQIAYVDEREHVIELYVAAGTPWQWADVTQLTNAPLVGKGPVVGYDWLNGRTKQIAYVDRQGHVIDLYVAIGVPGERADVTALTKAPPPGEPVLAGYVWVWEASKQIAYIDDQGQVIELHIGLGGQWNCANLTSLTKGKAKKAVTLR